MKLRIKKIWQLWLLQQVFFFSCFYSNVFWSISGYKKHLILPFSTVWSIFHLLHGTVTPWALEKGKKQQQLYGKGTVTLPGIIFFTYICIYYIYIKNTMITWDREPARIWDWCSFYFLLLPLLCFSRNETEVTNESVQTHKGRKTNHTFAKNILVFVPLNRSHSGSRWYIKEDATTIK